MKGKRFGAPPKKGPQPQGMQEGGQSQGEKFVEMQTVLEKVGVDKKDPNVKTERVRGDLFEKYRPLLEKKEDKVRKVFDNIVEAHDVIEWPEKSTKYTKFAKTPLTAMIAERTGVSNNQWIETVLAGGESKGKRRTTILHN